MKQTQGQIFLRFLKFGLLAWGGPVAQIAMIKKELVEEEKWVSKEEFNRALALYQALPGPEAHELCVYFGMKAGGRLGGFLAGLGFMLPGFVLMLLFTWLYVRFGIKSPMVQWLFAGVQAAVIALIVFAVYRIGKHAVINKKLFFISLFAALAFFIGVNFILILLIAGLTYTYLQKNNTKLVILFAVILSGLMIWTLGKRDFKLIQPKSGSVVQTAGTNKSEGLVLLTGFKAGLLTFGGAYTAIPFVQQDAVVKNGWMTQEQFLDGIAISGILPAPLIIFSTFVGYFGAGWIGAILITIGVFFPAFGFTLIGYSVIERLMANKALHNFLDGVTAGVVGLIGVTAIELFYSTITELMSVVIFTIALIVLIKFRSKYTVVFVILAAGLLSMLWNYSNKIFFKKIPDMKTVLLLLAVLLYSCNEQNDSGINKTSEDKNNVISCPPDSKLDIQKIEQITGMKGTEKNGEYKITIPQNDLNIVVDGFKIIPPMGLASWAAFTPCGDSAMVMGDIILTETDLKPVQQEVIRQGFAITAIHNHFVRNRPNVMYMHIDRSADITTLSNGVKAIFDKVKEVRGKDPKSEKADSVVNTLNIAMLDSLIGHKGEFGKGVYKYTIGRPDVPLREHGIPVSTFMGFNTWAAWQGTPERAAVAGDFTMLENEVTPVIKALVENGIEVVAVHNHMVHETPRIFFLHYWGVGNLAKLAQGLKAALNETGKTKTH